MKKIFCCLFVVVSSCVHKAPIQTVKIDSSYNRAQYEALGQKFAISTQGAAATSAAKKIFDEGGNIFDAAVAASFVISVERPQSTGLGGGGFMLLYSAKEKKTYAIDFREKAPLKAVEKMFQDENGNLIPNKSTTGIFAVGVPALVAGLTSIHQKFGKLPWDKVVQPAIDLAENGFNVYPHMAEALKSEAENLSKSPAAKSIFFNADGTIKKLGDSLVQEDLGKTLREIQTKGYDGFYNGWVKYAILTENNKHKGLLSDADFQQELVTYREPVKGTFQNFHVVSMPPPSSGGVHVIEILQILDSLDIAKFGPQHPRTIHYVSSAMQIAFSDRYKYMGDPDFNEIPFGKLLSLKYANENQLRLKKTTKAVPSSHYVDPSELNPTIQPKESTETTHFSMMDGEGNVVSTTQTINGWFGSKIMVAGTGVFLNNEMDDFTSKVGDINYQGLMGGKKNTIAPKKRPLSSMSPTIVFDWQNRPVLALGSPDGSRIISCVAEVILNYIEFKMPLFEAVTALRYHHQWYPDEIRVENPGFSEKLSKDIQAMGHKINQKNYSCKVETVAREGKKLHAVSDIRGEGMSLAE